MARTLLLLVTTFCLALTAHADLPRCSVECPVVGNHKLGYVPGQRYLYKQSGESSLWYGSVQGSQTDMKWSSIVELSVLTPCDVAITIKEFQMNGKDSSAVPELAEVSERPLIMAISDGKVQHVCVDPEDNTWAVNAKMSVASYLQNTLPSFSEINKETIITERDIQGKCTTNYTLTSTSQSDVHVVKQKDNKRCEDRYYQPSETSNNLPWLNMPLPLEVSNSTCHQTIKNGIYTSVMCTDVNVLKPMYGVYQNVTTKQKSTLQFQSKVQVDPALLKFSSNHLVKKQLKFDYTTPKKTSDVLPKLEKLLKQISHKVQESVEPEAASLVHQVMILLHHAPDSQLQIILQNIRSGAYGHNTQNLEHIYLDALTFLREPGVVPVMVQEISQGKASVARTALYAVAMHLLPRPNIFAIESLVPLFQMSQPPKTVLLAAASMLNTYLRQHPHHQEENHVQQIISLVTTKLQGLRNAATPEERDHAKLLLKLLSNVGYLPKKTVSVVQSLIMDKSVDTSIRVVATQTSRHIPCKLLDHRNLLHPYNDTEESTEIRIASYLSAIRCVTNMTELNQIVQRVINETNIQVRSLVITHLTNLQETSSPHKDHLRYLLSTTVLPTDYAADIRKFSRNTELSYFLRTLGLGAEIESNLVYSREAVLPRSLNMNVTLDLLGNMLNVAEVGARLEGFNSLVEGVFGPEGYLTSTPWDQVLRDINPFGEEGRSNVVEIVNQILSRTNSGSSSSEIKSFLENKVRSRQHEKTSPEIDLYLRLFGQEVSFASLTSDVLRLLQQKLSTTSLPSDLITFIEKEVLSYLADTQLNMVRALPINLEYTIPTMQGIPLDLSLSGAAVLGLNSTSTVDLSADNPRGAVKAVPSLSLQLEGFVGFKSIIRHGIKMENKLHTSNGGRVEVDVQKGKLVKIQWTPLPHKSNLLYFNSQTNLVKEWSPVLHKQPQQIILPQPQGDVSPFKVDKCLDRLQQDLGYRICFNANFPDLIRSTSVPFGQPIQVNITAEKTGTLDKAFSLTVLTTGQNDHKDISLVLETPGQAVAKANYRNKEDSNIISVSISSSVLKYSVESRLIVSDKIELIVHSSPTFDSKPTTPALQLLWISRNSKEYILKARTENDLRKIIQLDADVAIKMGYEPYSFIPSAVMVHKWMVYGKVSHWELRQQVETSSDITDFQFKLSKKGIPQIDISVKKTPIHFTIDGYTAVTLWNTGIKSIVALHLNDKGVNATWDVLNTRSTEKVLYASALVTRQEQGKVSYDYHIQIHIPSALDKVDIEGRIEKEDSSKYHVEGKTKYQNQIIYTIGGPITLDVTGKSDVNLEITGSSHRSYKFIGQLENSEKKLISVVVQNPDNPIFKAEIESVPKSDGGNLILTALEIPSLIKTKISFHQSRDIIDVYIYNNLFPEGQYEQTIKGSYSHSFVENKVTSNFLWKTRSGDPLEINLETKYVLEKGAPFTLRGDLVLNGRSHGYNTKIDISILPMFEGQNKINFVWTTATGKGFEIVANLDKKILPQKHSLTGSLHLKTVHDNDYTLTGKYELERLLGPREYQLQANIDLICPQTQATISVTDKKTGRERNVQITMDIPKSEVKAYVLGVVTTSDFKTKIDVKHASEQQILIESHGQIASHGLELIKSGELNVDLKLPFQMSKLLQVKSRKNEDGSMHAHIYMEPKRWKINVRKSTTHVVDVEVETPSRTLEAKVTLDSSNPSLQLWPNKGKSQDNIEISAKVSQTKRKNNQVLTIDGKFKVSQLNKEILVSAEYTNSTSELSGYLELKTPQSSQGLILLTLRGKKDHGIHANVSLSLKGSATTQPIRAQIVWTNSTKAIVLHSQTKEVAALKYQQIVPEEASLWARLKTSTIDTEVSTILRAEKTSYCHGLNIHANYKLHSHKYQTIARLCNPAYVQLVTFKKSHDNNQRMYVSLGMKSPYEIELDLHVEKPGKNLLQRYADVLSIKADVMTPRIVDLLVHYDTEAIKQIKPQLDILTTQLYESWHSIVQELREHEIYQSLKLLGVDIIYQSISKEMYDISEDLHKDNLIPNPDDIYVFVIEIYTYYVDIIVDIFGNYQLDFAQILKELKKVLLQLRELYEQDRLTPHEVLEILSHILPLEEVKEFIAHFKEEHPEVYQNITYVWETLKKVLGQLLPWKKTSGEPGTYSEEYQQLYESIFNALNTITTPLYPEGILKHIENSYPEMYTALPHVVLKILDSIKQDAHHLIKTSPLRQVIDWLLHGYKFDDVPQTDALIDSLYQLLLKTPLMIYDSTTERQLYLLVPFIYPEYSLTAVPYGTQLSTGLDLIRRIIGILQRILPVEYKPLDRVISSVAVYHGDGYLTTFDGTSIKLPESHCQYILTTDGYDYVAVTNLPGNKNEFELTVENGRHEIAIDKDYQIYINGTKRTEEEIHSSSHQLIVYQRPMEVVVVSPTLQLVVYKNAPTFRLYASTELQGRLQGVMAAFNDFQGDDIMMPNGRITHNPTAFLKSWQVKPSC